jgi:hypothetical protein
MDYRTATTTDLATIFRDLASRVTDEYAAAGMNLEEAKDEFLTSLKEGRAHTLVDDDKPVAIIVA